MQNKLLSENVIRCIRLCFVFGLLLISVSCGKNAEGMPDTKIIVVAYHDIDDKMPNEYSASRMMFVKQALSLRERQYVSINADDYLAWLRGEKVLPAKCFMLTFDDGNSSDYDFVYPVLKKLKLRATFFPVVNNIDRPGYLTSEQIRIMSHGERCSFGSHTLSHKRLMLLDDKEIEKEVAISRQKLEEITGKEVKTLAYPYGFWNESVKRALREAGYDMAFTVVSGFNDKNTDSLALRRIVVYKTITESYWAKLIDFDAELYRNYYTQLLLKAEKFGDKVTAVACQQELQRMDSLH
ncbi:MAG: polysaccharide deacetylase family protein [Desulfobulbaceae bacterium]|nr:polysaccharide deacetylase family protein [Desulfobulbaceae bacterium]